VSRLKDKRDDPAARLPRRSRKRSSNSAPDTPTPDDNLLYLMSELERAFKHPKVKWSADLATDLQRRVIRLLIEIGVRKP
jgi:hypothetical protein